MTVIKVDAEQPQDSQLSGAVFGLYNALGQKIAELTVDETSRAPHSGLPKSGYFLKELVAPEGFIPLDILIPFVITEQDEHIEISVPNAKGYGAVKITKHGENELLPGVVFEIYRVADDTKVAELTTGSDGTMAQELPLGRYYLLEKSTVAGYTPLAGRVHFTLEAEGATVELAIENQKQPAPEGSKIKVYRVSDDTKVAELVTGSDGTATSTALPKVEQGYYLLELAPPASYKATTEKFSVSVKSGETTEITIKNTPILAEPDPDPDDPEPGELILTKEAEDTGKKLSGAVFAVYSADGNKKQGEIKTGKNGTATINLDEGRYYLVERTAPQGFQLSSEKVYFRIRSGETTELTIENAPVPTDPKPDPTEPKPDDPDTGTLTLLKSAEGTGERLSGAVFGVYSVDGDKKQDEITTGANGMATIGLAEGKYYLKELTPPKNFIAEKDNIYFTISVDKNVRVEVTNMRDPTAIDDGKTPQGNITIPQTGGDFPAMSYAVSALCFALAAFCGAALLKRRRGIAITK